MLTRWIFSLWSAGMRKYDSHVIAVQPPFCLVARMQCYVLIGTTCM